MSEPAKMGWWAISGEALLDLLRRAYAGEDPDMLYAEEYANSDSSWPHLEDGVYDEEE